MRILSPEEVSQRREKGMSLQREGCSRRGGRLGLLSSFNVELGQPFLIEALDRAGIGGDVYLGKFGQVAQEVLDSESGLYQANPDSIVLIPAAEDLLAPLFAGPGRFSSEKQAQLVQGRIEELSLLVQSLIERLSSAVCYVVTFGAAWAPSEYALGTQSAERGQAAVERFLNGVRELGSLSPRVVVIDWDWYARRIGGVYRDERLWYLGRMRLNSLGLAELSDLIARHIAAFRGISRKVAVVDLDNTVWGGVLGEAGIKGIVLGEEGLGLAFHEFQNELLKLHDVGVVLAACSKNNEDEVWEAFSHHPSMVLKREHFAAERVNWQDKATNLRELAAELNLGLDAFVFFDDNPVERDWIKQALPQVLVPDLPEDPVERPGFLRGSPFFLRIGVTKADAQRTEQYRARVSRRRLEADAGTLEDFIASLQQEILIESLHDGSLARAAQMCQRTNQFNLTTHRYTSANLEFLLRGNTAEVYTLAVRDKFGDNGITGLAILRFEETQAEVDSLLLSCRILGRKIEDVFLAFLVQRALKRGVRHLVGRYIPTPKNGQVAGFYPERGFESLGEGLFRLDLHEHQLEVPSRVAVRVVTNV